MTLIKLYRKVLSAMHKALLKGAKAQRAKSDRYLDAVQRLRQSQFEIYCESVRLEHEADQLKKLLG